jgi:3alpha(or 20beta)-hydroxysteroid dehydrogenase
MKSTGSKSPLLGGKTVLVTGGARGLGAAIATSCVAHGASVIICDLLEDELHETVDSIGPAASGRPLDVTDPGAWDRLVDELGATSGRPDVLVNNAGVIAPTPIEETTFDAFQHTMAVNLGGAFLGIRAFVTLHRRTASTKPGSIVNISSVRGLVAGSRFAAYSASKFAVRGLTKVAAVELGELGIRVNAVCPGPVVSDMTVSNPDFATVDWDGYAAQLPLRRLGAPADVGEAVAWLGSDASSFVTGADLVVDGGLTATAVGPS